MNNKLTSIGIVALVVIVGFLGFITFESDVVRAGNIIYVDDVPGTGPGNPAENFTKIQDAINASNDGDTVFVYNGTYYEYVYINKTINLTGQDKNTTIIDGKGIGFTIKAYADWVNITGVTCRNSIAGVWIESEEWLDYHVQITDCIIKNNQYGVHQYTSGYHTIISNNNISNNDIGILFFYTDMNVVTDNNLNNNNCSIQIIYSGSNNISSNNMIKGGIFIYGDYDWHYDSNDINDNIINDKPIHFWKNMNSGVIPPGAGQVIIGNCSNVDIENQDIADCYAGIIIGFSSDIKVKANSIRNTYYGIFEAYSIGTNITNNRVSSNDDSSIFIIRSVFDNISGNNVSENEFGFFIYEAAFNNIFGNMIINNEWGINLSETCNNNSFYYNNIIDNINQVYLDARCHNIYWDDNNGKGNYWSDYNGLDDGSSGRTAGDGIGDTEIPHPYTDQGNGYHQLDNYPLMEPYNILTIPSVPQNLQANVGDGCVNLTWAVPSSDGGSAITVYNIYRNGTVGVYDSVSASQLWYNDTIVINGMTYTYNVSAINSVGEGPHSIVSATPMTVPSAPQNLQINAGDGYVNLTWDAPSDDGGSAITGYNIYRNGTTGVYSSISTSQLWYNDTSVINGMTYSYNVSAINSVGEGPHSIVSASPMTVPSAPQNLNANIGYSFVNLTWYAPTDNGGSSITNYRIYRDGVFLIEIGNVTFYNDTGLTNGQTYTYNVSAKNGVGEGALSIETSATPAAVPTAPQDLQVTAGDGQILLTWNASSFNGGSAITNYRIYRGTSAGDLTLLTTVGNVLTYTDISVTNGQIYYYKVSAVNTVGEGAQSNEASGTPEAVSTDGEDGLPVMIIVLIAIIVLIVIIFLVLMMKKKKPGEEIQKEEETSPEENLPEG